MIRKYRGFLLSFLATLLLFLGATDAFALKPIAVEPANEALAFLPTALALAPAALA